MAHTTQKLINGILTDVVEFDHSAQEIDDVVDKVPKGGAAPAGYGLGKRATRVITSQDELATITAGGIYYYYNGDDAIDSKPYFQYGTVVVFASEGRVDQYFFPRAANDRWMTRSALNAFSTPEWGAWEFGKVPADLSVEFRTTERWKGKTVYTKLVDCGAMPNATVKQVAHGAAATQMLRCCGQITGGSYLDSLPYWYSDTDYCTICASTTAIIMRSGTDLSARTATAQIWYTKD